eukprot:g2022.t1
MTFAREIALRENALIRILQRIHDPLLQRLSRRLISDPVGKHWDHDIVSLGSVAKLSLEPPHSSTGRTSVSDDDIWNANIEYRTLTAAYEPYLNELRTTIENQATNELPWLKNLNVNFSPRRPRNTSQKGEANARNHSSSSSLGTSTSLSSVGSVIAVSSCKGGVGKSTVTVELASAIQRMGGRVGIFDADLHGPSIPLLLPPSSSSKKDVNTMDIEDVGATLIPPHVSQNGIKTMSFGHQPNVDTVLRGPRASAAIKELLTKTQWGALDYLIIDMPPGTSDIHMTLAQLDQISIDGSIIVTTPSPLAVSDVERGISLFEDVNVPTLAVVENMASFYCEKCGHESFPFGPSQLDKVAQRVLASQHQLGGVKRANDTSDLGLFQLPFRGNADFGTVPELTQDKALNQNNNTLNENNEALNQNNNTLNENNDIQKTEVAKKLRVAMENLAETVIEEIACAQVHSALSLQHAFSESVVGIGDMHKGSSDDTAEQTITMNYQADSGKVRVRFLSGNLAGAEVMLDSKELRSQCPGAASMPPSESFNVHPRLIRSQGRYAIGSRSEKASSTTSSLSRKIHREIVRLQKQSEHNAKKRLGQLNQLSKSGALSTTIPTLDTTNDGGGGGAASVGIRQLQLLRELVTIHDQQPLPQSYQTVLLSLLKEHVAPTPKGDDPLVSQQKQRDQKINVGTNSSLPFAHCLELLVEMSMFYPASVVSNTLANCTQRCASSGDVHTALAFFTACENLFYSERDLYIHQLIQDNNLTSPSTGTAKPSTTAATGVQITAPNPYHPKALNAVIFAAVQLQAWDRALTLFRQLVLCGQATPGMSSIGASIESYEHPTQQKGEGLVQSSSHYNSISNSKDVERCWIALMKHLVRAEEYGTANDLYNEYPLLSEWGVYLQSLQGRFDLARGLFRNELGLPKTGVNKAVLMKQSFLRGSLHYLRKTSSLDMMTRVTILDEMLRVQEISADNSSSPKTNLNTLITESPEYILNRPSAVLILSLLENIDIDQSQQKILDDNTLSFDDPTFTSLQNLYTSVRESFIDSITTCLESDEINPNAKQIAVRKLFFNNNNAYDHKLLVRIQNLTEKISLSPITRDSIPPAGLDITLRLLKVLHQVCEKEEMSPRNMNVSSQNTLQTTMRESLSVWLESRLNKLPETYQKTGNDFAKACHVLVELGDTDRLYQVLQNLTSYFLEAH